jgi:hypothetical protein
MVSREDILHPQEVLLGRSWHHAMGSNILSNGWVGIAHIPVGDLLDFYVLAQQLAAAEWYSLSDISVGMLSLQDKDNAVSSGQPASSTHLSWHLMMKVSARKGTRMLKVLLTLIYRKMADLTKW